VSWAVTRRKDWPGGVDIRLYRAGVSCGDDVAMDWAWLVVVAAGVTVLGAAVASVRFRLIGPIVASGCLLGAAGVILLGVLLFGYAIGCGYVPSACGDFFNNVFSHPVGAVWFVGSCALVLFAMALWGYALHLAWKRERD